MSKKVTYTGNSQTINSKPTFSMQDINPDAYNRDSNEAEPDNMKEGSSEEYVVNITFDEENQSYADRQSDEIFYAFKEGKRVYGIIKEDGIISEYLNYLGGNIDGACFGRLAYDVGIGTLQPQIITVNIGAWVSVKSLLIEQG